MTADAFQRHHLAVDQMETSMDQQEAARLSCSRALSLLCSESKMELLWHFYRSPSRSTLLHNAFIGKGIVATIGTISFALPGAVSKTDLFPALGDFERVLEDIRSKEFPNKTSRKGATFLFDDEATCRRYASAWAKGQDVHILRCAIVQGSWHRGHLGWMSNQPSSSWERCARSYWVGNAAHPPHDWETVVNGTLFFPDWEQAPFGYFADMSRG